jgi:hypothetical protein
LPYEPAESLKKQVADNWKRSSAIPVDPNTKH